MTQLTKADTLMKGLPPKQRKAILKLIDFATEDQMDKLLNALEVQTEKNNARFLILEEQMKTIKWLLGIGFTVLGLIIAVKG